MKKLYRSQSDVMIAGVCSGLADYLGVDVTIIRLVFVLLFFTMTGGFWIYLALWIIMPVAPSENLESVDVQAKPEDATPKKIAASTKAKEKETGSDKSK